ncbi:MAG: sulfatase-like hydrolase/transferase [Planctomycetota bacterium]
MFTPHLDWLADEGVRFTRAYSDCPVCVPARATIMTGRHGFNQGLTANKPAPVPAAEHPTLPGLLTAAGYQTRAVGKMHFKPTRACYGFEHTQLPFDYVREQKRLGRPTTMEHGLGQNEMHPGMSTVDEAQSLTRWIVDRSIDFIETRDPTRPFFLWTSFTKPHPPFDPDPKYWAMYDGIPMPPRVTGDWSRAWELVPDALKTDTIKFSQIHRFSEPQLAASRRAYYACISQVDYNLGLLFARLRETGLLENTWIVFTSDHGEMLGDHWLSTKSLLLEPAANVPLIIRPPSPVNDLGVEPGTTRDGLVCLADLLPNFLALASVDPPSGIDGRNLLAQPGQADRRERLFGAVDDRVAVIEQDLKLHRCLSDDSELMFDLTQDPLETRNLAGDPTHATERTRLAGLLDALGWRRPHASAEHQPSLNRWPGFHSTEVESDVFH